MKDSKSLKLDVNVVFFYLLFASILLSGVTATADNLSPAENFYTWTNRKWLAKTDIPADKPRVDNFTKLEDDVADELRELIKELKAKKIRTSEEEKIVRLYDSFVDLKQRDAKGITPITDELAKIDSIKSHLELAKLFAYFQTVGIVSPVIIAPQADFKDSSMNIGIISQAGLGIERDYYIGKDDNSLKQQKLYRAYLSKLFKLASIHDAQVATDRVLELEGKLAEIQWSQVENRNMTKIYNPTTAKGFIKVSSSFYGDEMMKVLGVPSMAKISISQPSYIKKYSKLFRSTKLSIWQDYARARLLTTYSELLTSEFKAAKAQYQQDLGLVQKEQEHWRQGIEFVGGATNMLLGRAYVEKYFNKEIKATVTELVLSIRDTYRSSIDQAIWMSKETRNKAIEKLDKMQFKIGYPDHWKDYSTLEIPGTDLAENFRRVNLYDHKRNMEEIGRPVNRDEWENSPHEVNAFYEPTRNEFVLLAAILHEPLYSDKGSAAMKYGSLGFIVGHEIGHGFDDQGSSFDGDGNLVNWWKKSDAKAYSEKKQQLIEQANAYEILPDTYLKGEQEIGEIMGDLSGAQIAFRAYKKTPDASDKEFFSQLSQTWRSKWRDEFLLMVIHRDVHPPSEFRSNGIVKQFDEFYKAYSIKPGDKMYLPPEKRVLMW